MISGRLPLRPPQAESLERLRQALEVSPELLSHERDVPPFSAAFRPSFRRLRTSSAMFLLIPHDEINESKRLSDFLRFDIKG